MLHDKQYTEVKRNYTLVHFILIPIFKIIRYVLLLLIFLEDIDLTFAQTNLLLKLQENMFFYRLSRMGSYVGRNRESESHQCACAIIRDEISTSVICRSCPTVVMLGLPALGRSKMVPVTLLHCCRLMIIRNSFVQ